MLATAEVDLPEPVDARREKIDATQAVTMARKLSRLTAARGKNVVTYQMGKENPSDEDLIKIMVGPSGNLRAPAIRSGKQMFIGFHEDELNQFLGS